MNSWVVKRKVKVDVLSMAKCYEIRMPVGIVNKLKNLCSCLRELSTRHANV